MNQLLGVVLGKLFHCVVLDNIFDQNLFYIFISPPLVHAFNIVFISGQVLLLCIDRFLIKPEEESVIATILIWHLNFTTAVT